MTYTTLFKKCVLGMEFRANIYLSNIFTYFYWLNTTHVLVISCTLQTWKHWIIQLRKMLKWKSHYIFLKSQNYFFNQERIIRMSSSLTLFSGKLCIMWQLIFMCWCVLHLSLHFITNFGVIVLLTDFGWNCIKWLCGYVWGINFIQIHLSKW